MATQLATASALKPEIRLAQGIARFQFALSDDQRAAFSELNESRNTPPDIHDVMHFTASIDRKIAGDVKSGRCFGTRLVNVMESVQQFAAIGDILVGGSQNIPSCAVWSVIRMTLLVSSLYMIALQVLTILLDIY